MGSPIIWFGNAAKLLKFSLNFGKISITDPNSTSYTITLPGSAPSTNGQALTALTSGVASWTSIPTASAGDIGETSFSAANNQVAAANVTGLAFANGTVRSFDALVSVYINATASLYEVFKLSGIQKGASWDMAVESNGDSSGVTFSITNAGQVQYTSGNSAGFVADTMKFRAITTSV